MKNIFRISFFVFSFAACLVNEELYAQVNNDYWIVVPANYDTNFGNVPLLTVMAENPTTVTVKAANATYTVTANQAGYTIPTAMPMIPQHRGVVKRAIHAYSLDGLPFRVQLTLNPEEWGEGTWCIPTHSLGKMYRIVGYKASKSGIHPEDYPNSNGVVTPEFAIVATKDNTQITIDFPPGKNLASINITMNAGDAYHVDCGKLIVKIDPTGTRITANQPIAVFSGQANADVGGKDYGNALLEQMFPIESWGKLHNIVSDPLQEGDVYCFVADCDSTQISNDGALIATIDAGKFYEVTISGGHEICSTKPIEVAKFTKGGNQLYVGAGGGPSMLVIPPVNCYFDSSRFYQLDIPVVRGGNGVPGVVIICPTVYTPLVLIDGVPVAGFQPITNSCSPIQYSWTYTPISIATAGSHTLCYLIPPAANPYSLYGYYTAQDGDRDENLAWNIGYRSPKMPLASLMPGNLDFGRLICDTTKTMSIKLSNVGTAPLVISSVSGLTTPFMISGITLPDTLQPGDSLNGAVTFTSSTAGTYIQTLALATNENGICGPPIDTIHIEARKERAAITSAPASYDFGDVYCQSYETTVTETNVGTVDVQVTNKIFSQPGLSIVTPNLPVTIKPSDTQSFTIRLDATMIPLGAYTSMLHLVSQPCNLTSDFVFTANRKTLVYSVSPTKKDFGITAVNKTSNGLAVFSNPNSSAVRISSIKFSPAFPGTITTPFPQTVAPNGTLAINFTATPPDTGVYKSDLVITIDSACPDEKRVAVSVEGASVCPQAQMSGVVGKVPGDVTMIPIVINPSTKFSGTKQIDIKVKYDPELLRYAGEPTTSLPGGYVTNIQPLSDGVSFTVTTNGLPTPAATIAEVKVEALLAPYRDGSIDVSSSMFTLQSGEQIAGASCPVAFSLGSDCVKPNQLQHKSSATIEGIYPNPTQGNTKIVLNVIGSPSIQLEVFDIFGRKVQLLHGGVLTDGSHELEFETKAYSNGIYFCRLLHNGSVTTREFNVRR